MSYLIKKIMVLIYGLKKFFRFLISYFYDLLGFMIGETRAKKIKFLILRVIKGFRQRNTLKADVLRLAELVKIGKRLKLHFGSDVRVLKDWINIDIAPYRYRADYPFSDPPELRGGREDFFQIDFRECSLPFPDNSVELIFHEDFIEHLTQKETVLFLAETYRVLMPGGIHRVNTPELLSSLKKHCDFKKGILGVDTEEWDRYGHHHVLTKRFLEELAKSVGYREVVFNGRNKSSSNLIPKEYRPGDDRTEEEQIFCDLIK